MVYRDFILAKTANYVSFYPFFNLRILFYLIRKRKIPMRVDPHEKMVVAESVATFRCYYFHWEGPR